MPVEISELDRRITIERIVSSTTNDKGEEIPTWGTLAVVWAKFEARGGTELMQAMEATAQRPARFVIRYIDGLTPKDRVVYRSQIYELQAVNEIDEWNRRRAFQELLGIARSDKATA